jgi:hypothetical protein
VPDEHLIGVRIDGEQPPISVGTALTRLPLLRAMMRKPRACSHWLLDGSVVVFVGRHGAMNPAGRVGCNMRAK